VPPLVSASERAAWTPGRESLPRLAPAVEKALLAGGFTIDARPPLMTCRRGGETSAPVPDGIELLVPSTDEELHGLLVAQHEGFGEAPPTDDGAAGMRRSLAGGLLAV